MSHRVCLAASVCVKQPISSLREAFGPSRAPTVFSRAVIQEGQRWQFCSTTQDPSTWAFSIIRSATGPWPCPSEMYDTWSIVDVKNTTIA